VRGENKGDFEMEGDRGDLDAGAVFARITRRHFIRLAGASALAAGIAPVLAACGGDDEEGAAPAPAGSGAEPAPAPAPSGATGRAIKIGYVSPQTGALAPFGEADSWTIDQMNAQFADGLDIGGTLHPIEIILKDTQSDPNRAAEVTNDVILNDEVDLVIPGATPETTNPVADTAEANGVPCISTVCPWQPWFFGRNGDPEVGFQWTYHFFWGLEDIIAVFLDMWSQVDNNQVVGAIWPNDADGNAWGDPQLGFPPPLTDAGYTIVDPGRFPSGTEDFSAQISQFKSEGVEIVTGVPVPPDFTTFWTQSAQQGFQPKIASVGKALLFPSSVEALGDLGNGMSTEVWWSPTFPFASSLTGQSSQELADAWTADTGKQWTQPVGYVHAVFEVAADVLGRTADVDDPASIIEAIKATNVGTVAGTVAWGDGPVPNVAKMQLAGGQWVPGTDTAYDLQIVSNSLFPDVTVAAALQPIPYS
jgi:branched-chain amino acid transport system substrate-binding protein